MARFPSLLAGTIAALALASVQAQPWQPRTAPGEGVNPAREPEPVVSPYMSAEALEGPRAQLIEATQVVRRMKADPDLLLLMKRARGLFILTDYGRAAAGIGVQGGRGVLVTRRGEDFGNPVFYNMGALTIGPQIGAAGGEAAYLLMTERAVQRFLSDRTFSLTAGAGLTFANYQARGLAATGKVSDVVVWSGAPGLYAGLNVGVSGIAPDEEANRAYYGREDATPMLILTGRIPNPHNNILAMVLGI